MSDTMILWNRTLAVLYVDSAAVGANNGSSPTDALTALPAQASMAASTVYLVRRGNTQTWTLGTSSVSRLAIMAMPLSTDPLYRLLPAAAIAAWAGDAGTYATLNIAAGNTAFTHTGNYWWMHGIDIVSPASGTAVSAANNTFTFTTNGWTMTKCKYRTSGVDLTTMTAAPARGLRNWKITGNWAYARDLDWSCCDLFDGNVNSNGSLGWLYIVGNDATVERSVAIVTAQYNVTMFPFVYVAGDRATIQDIAVSLVAVYASTIGAIVMGGAVGFAGGMRPIIKDITATYTRFFSSATAWTTQNFQGWSGSSQGLIFANNFWGGEFSNWVADFSTNNAFTTTTVAGALISINMTPLWHNKKPSVLDSLTAKVADANTGAFTAAGSAAMYLSGHSASLVRSPIAWCLNGVGIDASNGNDPQGGSCGLSIDNASVKGKLKLAGNLRCHVATMSSTLGTATPHISLVGSGTGTTYTGSASTIECLIESLTLPVGQLTEQIAVDDFCVLGIETCNVTPVYTQGTTILNRGLVCINNEAGVSGSFRCRTLDNEFKTVNAYRTGGASAALKMTPLASGGWPAYLGPKPFPGLTIATGTVGATGNRTITVYAAYKGYSTAPLSENLWIELEVPNGGSGTKTRVISTRGYGNWETDASTWNNDSGLTIVKQVITFPYDRAEDVKLRIGCDWFQAGCYALVDPLPAFA